MKLGFVSAILDGWTYEEMMDVAGSMGFKAVEVACCVPEMLPDSGNGCIRR